MLTSRDFYKAFKTLGIKKEDNVIIHGALKKFGPILNHAHDIIDPLLKILTSEGTLLCSSNTGNITDPKYWKNPPVKNYVLARKQLRTFDPKSSLPYHRGKLAEVFFCYPKVYRSNHPVKSIMAIGKNAKYFTNFHNLHDPEGKNSPLHKLYKKNGKSLFIGTDLNSFSAMHVAENLADVSYLYNTDCFVIISEGGKKKSIKLKKYSIALNFNRIENQLIDEGFIKIVKVNNVKIQLANTKKCVDYATKILKTDPEYFLFNKKGERNEV